MPPNFTPVGRMSTRANANVYFDTTARESNSTVESNVKSKSSKGKTPTEAKTLTK